MFKTPVDLYLCVGNVLTNMHTCLYGSALQRKYGMEVPDLDRYMNGNGRH